MGAADYARLQRMHGTVLGPADGELLADRPRRTAIIKAGVDELALIWFRYDAGMRGPEVHVHREHSDGFYVIDGEMTFELGGDVVRGGPGTFVLVPPGVSHTFRNEGPATGTFLNFHAPSCRFHEELLARRDGLDPGFEFDQFDPPPDGGRPASDATVATGGVSGEHVSLEETWIEPGQRRDANVASYWVLEGTLRLRAGDDHLAAEPGSCVLLPPGQVHTIESPARVVTISA
jgi:mannose-6-phosphate isomerase-like protein (cupin superfamily)